MTRHLSLLCAVALLCGCSTLKGLDDEKPYTPPPLPVKKIADKQSPNENRFSGTDFVFGSGSITKTTTVYYLIAGDGTVCEVSLSEYSRAKVGDDKACMWEEK